MDVMEIRALIDQVRKVCEDPRYEEKRELWKRFEQGEDIGRPPVTVFSRSHDWALELGFDLLKYYTDPEYYLEINLRTTLYRHERIFDDSVLAAGVGIEFGGAFEPSLLGVGVVFRPDSTPWPGQPVVKDESDLEKLRIPDIYKSGVMPQVHRFHDVMSKIAGKGFPVGYPSWTRGPWGIVVHMMGWQNALLSLVKQSRLLERLLDFVTEARIAWEKDWGRFAGKEAAASSLSNDEVDAKVLSPRSYRELVLPREKKLADFYRDGISYFHSCGNITPFLRDIATLRGLKTVHVSPWTDMRTAMRLLEPRLTLQKWIHPEDMLLTEEDARARFTRILADGAGRRMLIVNAGAVKDTIRWLQAVKPIMDKSLKL
ncbi:MAG: uroporphyrinogen decarboxylase family protein [Candidatus Bathyarchaeia archaeon]